MKEAQIVATIHRIGEDIIALADYLAAYVKEEQTIAENTVTPVAGEAPAVPTIKLEDVRTVLAEISRSGKTAQMKELLGRFGRKAFGCEPEDMPTFSLLRRRSRMPDVHAKFSPSASDRLIHCPPSLMLASSTVRRILAANTAGRARRLTAWENSF